jgi:hypothetical protein
MTNNYKGCITSRRLLSERLYTVRQIVAFYRTDVAMWRFLTIKYLQVYEILDNEPTAATCIQRSDADIIDAITDVVSQAIEYLSGYHGNYQAIYDDALEDEYESGKYAYF